MLGGEGAASQEAAAWGPQGAAGAAEAAAEAAADAERAREEWKREVRSLRSAVEHLVGFVTSSTVEPEDYIWGGMCMVVLEEVRRVKWSAEDVRERIENVLGESPVKRGRRRNKWAPSFPKLMQHARGMARILVRVDAWREIEEVPEEDLQSLLAALNKL